MCSDVNMPVDHPGQDREPREIVGSGFGDAVADLDDPRTFDRNDGVAQHATLTVEEGSGPDGDGLLRARRRGHAQETG